MIFFLYFLLNVLCLFSLFCIFFHFLSLLLMNMLCVVDFFFHSFTTVFVTYNSSFTHFLLLPPCALPLYLHCIFLLVFNSFLRIYVILFPVLSLSFLCFSLFFFFYCLLQPLLFLFTQTSLGNAEITGLYF